jgi:hypothetical protein
MDMSSQRGWVASDGADAGVRRARPNRLLTIPASTVSEEPISANQSVDAALHHAELLRGPERSHGGDRRAMPTITSTLRARRDSTARRKPPSSPP